MTNKKIGNDFESELCDLLFDNGFWAHNMALNKSGQPADVIAVKNGKAFLIDCKVCSAGKFDLTRMEENQDSAMKLWNQVGNGEGWFAVKLNSDIYMIPHTAIVLHRKSQSYLNENEIRRVGTLIDRWLYEHDKGGV